MKWAVLALGLWLASAQGFASSACCWNMPSTKASCGHCGDQAGNKPAPRPDCCTSLESQKDIDTSVTKHEIPSTPVTVDLLPLNTGSVHNTASSISSIATQAVCTAEGPPLYLRFAVLLI